MAKNLFALALVALAATLVTGTDAQAYWHHYHWRHHHHWHHHYGRPWRHHHWRHWY